MTEPYDELEALVKNLIQKCGDSPVDSPQKLVRLAGVLQELARDAKSQASAIEAAVAARKREQLEIASYRISAAMFRNLLDGMSVRDIATTYRLSASAGGQRIRSLITVLCFRVNRSHIAVHREQLVDSLDAPIRELRAIAAAWKQVLDLFDQELELRAKGQPFWQEVWKAPAWNESSEHSADPVE